jgi:hypothetical protein
MKVALSQSIISEIPIMHQSNLFRPHHRKSSKVTIPLITWPHLLLLWWRRRGAAPRVLPAFIVIHQRLCEHITTLLPKSQELFSRFRCSCSLGVSP